MMQQPSKLRGARGGCGRTPFTATIMTIQSPGCPSNLCFIAAVVASKSASTRPFPRRRGLDDTTPPLPETLVPLSLLVLFAFGEDAGVGCFGTAALLALFRGLTAPLPAGEIVPSVRSAPNARRPERPVGEGEEDCFGVARVRSRLPTDRFGESGAVVPDEAPALGVDAMACNGDALGGLLPFCRGVVVAAKWSADGPPVGGGGDG